MWRRRILNYVCVAAEEDLSLEKMGLFPLGERQSLLKVKALSCGLGGSPSWRISVLRGVRAKAGWRSVKDVWGASCSGNLDSMTSFCGPITMSSAMDVPVRFCHPWAVFSLN